MDWLAYFKGNRVNREEIPWDIGITVEPHLRPHLIRSLQRFQMGERGDGSHLKRVAAQGGASYTAAIHYFVEEEQEHAALMAEVLHGLGAPLLESHWSNRCFRLICLASGLRTELLVLLTAEIIAKRYFRLLYQATGDSMLRAVCSQIRQDEEAHIAFHADTLKLLFAGLPTLARPLVRIAWRLFFSLVCLVVICDHHKLLRASKVSMLIFLRDCLRIFDGVAAHVFTHETALAGNFSQAHMLQAVPKGGDD